MKRIREHPSRSLGFLSRHHDGELSRDEIREFERHVADCPECADAAAEYEAILALYRDTVSEEPDASLAERISRRVDAEIRQRASARFLAPRIDLLWAGVAVGLVGVLAWYGVLARRKPAGPVILAEKSPIVAPQSPGAVPRAPAVPTARSEAPRRFAPEAGSVVEKKSRVNSPETEWTGTAESAPRASGDMAAGRSAKTAPAPQTQAMPAPEATADLAPKSEMSGAEIVQQETPPEGARDEPLRIGPGITPPVLLRRVEPVISESMRDDLAAAGTIIVEAEITRNGDVNAVRMLRPISPSLGQAIKAALQRWKYRPALRDGKKVAVYLTVTFNVALR